MNRTSPLTAKPLATIFLAFTRVTLGCVIITSGPAHAADGLPPPVKRDVEFNRDVRPIFEKHCVSCHGSEKRESGLRLDRRQDAMLGGDSGKAIQAGSSELSRLIHYVVGLDPDTVMPPKGEKLTAESIGVLRKWIDQGAAWPETSEPGGSGTGDKSMHWAYKHWAYKHWSHQHLAPQLSPGNPTRNQGSEWSVHPIDQFIASKLDQANLEPSPQADKATLIRRLYLDLLGLLPPIDEVERFVDDSSGQAYEALVDRVLESPHFGERWGRHWLDMARYADSDGYEKDNPRPDAYRWRDWVIDAINSDMPFDQFTIEQIAGDLLPNATDMQRLATAFHRQTLTNTEGGTDKEQFRVEACFDRTETTGAVWLGLTIGCARCHSHKYDAISQREYYQLFAFFNNGDETTHTIPKSQEEIDAYKQAKKIHDHEVDELNGKLSKERENRTTQFASWERSALADLEQSLKDPLVRKSLEDVKANGATQSDPSEFLIQEDGSILVGGANPDSAIYTIVGRLPQADFRSIRLDVLADKKLPANGPGRVKHGNFVLSEIGLEASPHADFSDAKVLEFVEAKADHEQTDRPWRAADAIDRNPETGWAIGPEYGKDHWAVFQLKEPFVSPSAVWFRITLSQQYGKQHTIGRFKLSVQSGTQPQMDIPEKIATILKAPAGERTPAQQEQLLDHFSRTDHVLKKIVAELDALKKKEPAKPEIVVRVISEHTKEPRNTFVLRRGEFLEPIEDAVVQPSGLASVHPFKPRLESTVDRLDLAHWLIAKENPLTPRVIVNHLWRILFGAGIVRTANDFGVRGETPTHPELLDWLAGDFVEPAEGKAWSLKRMIKRIVMSSTYRQSSAHRPEIDAIDPQNRLLARQNRLRVEGEIVRDISLDAAGLLSKTIGGPSVFPALPPGIAELSYAGNFKWSESKGSDRYRRGMYTFFKRTAPHPNLITFDCPDANLTCVDRNRSNTPLQALVALNNDSFTEAAKALAKRILTLSDIKDDRARVARAFRICVARSPSENETGQLVDLLLASHNWYRDHPEQAHALVESMPVASVSEAENAAWVALARILINLDEFITRE